MNVLFFIFVIIIFIIFFKFCIFKFIPKKSREMYSIRWVHRGWHFYYPENTIKACKEPLIKEKGWGVELDVRRLNDGNIICFHDFYTNRLLSIPGTITKYSYNELKEYNILDSKETVPLLKNILEYFEGDIPVLIDVKGYMNKNFRRNLLITIFQYETKYKTKVYFQAKNLFTYFKLYYFFPRRTFWVYNIFRKRFNFIKGSDYKKVADKYQRICEDTRYMQTNNLEIPTVRDLSAYLVEKIEGNEPASYIFCELSSILNKSIARVDDMHWICKSLIFHRAIISDKFKEHSIEAIRHIIRFAEKYLIYVTIECDVMMYNGEVVCYHSDNGSDWLGQEKSCAKKEEIQNSIKFCELINELKGHEKYVNLIIDMKDGKYKDRTLQIKTIEILKKYQYTGNFAMQAFFPPVLIWLKENYPEIIRGQVYNSLKKFAKVNFIRKAVHLILAHKSCADYCVYDNSQYIWAFLKFQEIIGKKVIVYAFKNEHAIKAFIGKENIANVIVENIIYDIDEEDNYVLNSRDWSKKFIERYKVKKI